MPKYIFILLIFFPFNLAFQNQAQAAMLKMSDTQLAGHHQKNRKESSGGNFKRGKKTKSWFAKIKFKLEKKAKKAKSKPGRENAKKHLIACLGLVVLSIIAFALSGQGQVFSILGSVFAIGAAVFFVLWLLNFLGKI